MKCENCEGKSTGECTDCNGPGKDMEQTGLSGLAARENGEQKKDIQNESKPDQEKQQSTSDEIREAFFKSGKKDRPEKFPSWIDGDEPYSIEPVYRQGFYIGYNAHKQKSQSEIKKIDSERKLFSEQYEKYLHLCSDQSNHIKQLEQQIKDMEYKEKYL